MLNEIQQKKMTNYMLKIKTLNPQVRNPKLIKLIKDSKVPKVTIAECLGLSGSWFNTILNHKKLDKHDVDVIKKVIRALSKGDEQK